MSSSVDNLSPKQRLTGIRKPEVKPVLPPSIKPKITDTWQVDNSWKFVGKLIVYIHISRLISI